MYVGYPIQVDMLMSAVPETQRGKLGELKVDSQMQFQTFVQDLQQTKSVHPELGIMVLFR